MILTPDDIHAIRNGTITLAFRRWKRKTVKTGGTLTTEMGVLAIDDVQIVSRSEITDDDARRAGHTSRDALLALLDTFDGEIHRVALRYVGEDPRVALREQDTLTDDELADIVAWLARLDRAASASDKGGPWTTKVLRAIDAHPRMLAAAVARRVDMDRDVFKAHVRKLKAKGLTESHERGYSLSPRGRRILRALDESTAR